MCLTGLEGTAIYADQNSERHRVMKLVHMHLVHLSIAMTTTLTEAVFNMTCNTHKSAQMSVSSRLRSVPEGSSYNELQFCFQKILVERLFVVMHSR